MQAAQDRSRGNVISTTGEERKHLCKYDLPHIGHLLKKVRSARELTPADIARQCCVETSTISRNIEQQGQGKETIPCYLEALRQTQLNDGTLVYRPLSEADTDILDNLHRDQ